MVLILDNVLDVSFAVLVIVDVVLEPLVLLLAKGNFGLLVELIEGEGGYGGESQDDGGELHFYFLIIYIIIEYIFCFGCECEKY